VLKLCPRCGAKSDRKKFIGLFCEDCYAGRLNVEVERVVTLEVCKRCGKLRAGREWAQLTHANIERLLKHAVRGTYDNVRFVFPESGAGDAQAVFLITAGDDFVESVKQFRLVKHFTICESDSRASSGYFEAVVQVRCPDIEKTRRLAEKVKSALERRTFITRFEEGKHGIDIYAGSNKVVMETLEKLGLKAEKSATLHGVKDGQRIYRNTYCVRG